MHRSYDRNLENSSVYQINKNKYNMYHTAQKAAQQLGESKNIFFFNQYIYSVLQLDKHT